MGSDIYIYIYIIRYIVVGMVEEKSHVNIKYLNDF